MGYVLLGVNIAEVKINTEMIRKVPVPETINWHVALINVVTIVNHPAHPSRRSPAIRAPNILNSNGKYQ